ncbi:MAG: hypothetical protein RO257_07180 [Candidatus Kapabacteria bacterium]|nr:hypothetical protein [Candidatus Kapabacteria bacterium]
MTYEINENEILVRIPVSNNKQKIKEILDFLLYETITTRVEVSQDTADKIAGGIKKGRFNRLNSSK